MIIPVAKIAVSAATYWIDKPYSYRIPEKLLNTAVPGCRVYVPFSRGNRISEGIILAIEEEEESVKLKESDSVLDLQPVITQEQIQLAIFMRERFFCTLYDAVKAMLPAGLWFKDSGTRRIKDKMVEYACLEIPAQEAMDLSEKLSRKSPKQSAILRELAYFGEMRTDELQDFLRCSKASLNLSLIHI